MSDDRFSGRARSTRSPVPPTLSDLERLLSLASDEVFAQALQTLSTDRTYLMQTVAEYTAGVDAFGADEAAHSFYGRADGADACVVCGKPQRHEPGPDRFLHYSDYVRQDGE